MDFLSSSLRNTAIRRQSPKTKPQGEVKKQTPTIQPPIVSAVSNMPPNIQKSSLPINIAQKINRPTVKVITSKKDFDEMENEEEPEVFEFEQPKIKVKSTPPQPLPTKVEEKKDPFIVNTLKTPFTRNEGMPFRSNIQTSGRIIALSDVHGDINGLIIALRDCAKVIRKRDESKDELNMWLNYDLLEKDITGYLIDLGYEWCGDNTHVVLVGDTIDSMRQGTIAIKNPDGTIKYEHEYPQVELKIILLLNKLDDYAIRRGGRVIKLTGNHELINLMGNTQFVDQFTFDGIRRTSDKPYFKHRGIEYTRNNFFKKGNLGHDIFRHNGTGILVKINNFVFIHGRTTDLPYEKYKKYNNWLNGYANITYEELKSLQDTRTSPLWNRDYGSDKDIHERFHNNKEFCEQVDKDILKFCEGTSFDPNKIKVVVGHCIQSYSTIYNQRNSTFRTIEEITDSVEVLSGDSDGGLPEFSSEEKVSGKSMRIFGITMECGIEKSIKINDKKEIIEKIETEPRIYRVDIGMSRGFDVEQMSELLNNVKTPEEGKFLEHNYIFSRTPQVLEVLQQGDKEKVRIIRSKIKNTRIHQPRTWFENAVKSKGDIMSNLDLTKYGGYRKKYYKYKSKYLQLKKSKSSQT